MVNKSKILIELSSLIIILSLSIAGIGIYGLIEIKGFQKSSQELYNDRLVPMKQLGDIQNQLSQILLVANQAADHRISFQVAEEQISNYRDSVAGNWKAYLKTYLVPEEKEIVEITSKDFEELKKYLNQLEIALSKSDGELVQKLAEGGLESAIRPVLSNAKQLYYLQVKVGHNIYKQVLDDYAPFANKIILVLMIVIGTAIPFTFYLIRKSRGIIDLLNLNKERLEESEQNYKNLVELAGDPIIVANEHMQIIDVNSKAIDLWGYTRDEILKLKIIDLISPKEFDRFDNFIKRLKKNKLELYNRVIKRKDGLEVETEVSTQIQNNGIYFSIVRDITERNQADKALKESEEKYRTLFDNTPANIMIYDLESLKVLQVNQLTIEKYGYNKEEWAKMTAYDFRPEKDHQKVREVADILLNSDSEGTIYRGNWLHLKKDGEPMFMDISSQKIRFEGRSAIMSIGYDITDKWKAEEKLIQSEEKYRVLTENISDAIVLINENFEVVYHSAAAERVSGYTIDEVEGMSILDFMIPTDRQQGEELLKSIRDTHGIPTHNQFRVIDKYGQVKWLEGTAINLLKNESVNGIIINYRDVTIRKAMEEKQALMASIIDSSEDAIISKDFNGFITSWNKGAENVLGYTSEEVLGKHISMLIPLNRRGEASSFLEKIKDGKSIENYQTQRIRKNGEMVNVVLTISPIRDSSGKVVGASKILHDITDRIRYEQELLRYNKELEKTNEELDRFVYSVSHDLRAPLKSALGLVNMTKEEIEEGEISLESDLEDLIMRFSMLNECIVRLDDFIEEILNYSKNSRTELIHEVIDIKKLVDETVSNLKYINSESRIDISLKINSSEKFMSDPNRLRIVLNNLMSNALKYYDAEKQNPFTNVFFFCNEDKATIIIEDNGIGIAEKEREKIFDMFYRSTILSTGSGIGLYIVKETLKKIGGSIRVESVLKMGAKFIVEIPNCISHSSRNLNGEEKISQEN